MSTLDTGWLQAYDGGGTFLSSLRREINFNLPSSIDFVKLRWGYDFGVGLAVK